VLPNGETGLVSTEGRTETNIKDDGVAVKLQYYDYNIGKTFSFDPFNHLEGVEIDSEEVKEVKTCDLRKALLAELDTYTKKNYSANKVKYCVY
jgi:uncharacterized protein YtpQ (UPF0354 family)